MDKVKRKITYRLYPSATQEPLLAGYLALHCCRLYNALLEEHRRRYDAGQPTLDFSSMCKEITA